MTSFTGEITVADGSVYDVTGTYTVKTPVAAPAPSSCYFGVWDSADVNWNTPSGDPVVTWDGASQFTNVKSLTYYTGWLGPLPVSLFSVAAQHGATPYINLEPWNTWGGKPDPTMQEIANGTYDAYLTSVGDAIKASGKIARVTFAHEMNGNWYPWGIQSVTPAQWVTTWKHVYDVIHAAAGSLAAMTWCPNNNDVGPVTPYWPGQEYVDIPAFDGYLNQDNAGQTYDSFIKPTVTEIGKLTTSPVWNAETGVAPGSLRITRYPQFIKDMQAAGLAGFTQFNQGSYKLTTEEVAAVNTAVKGWDNG